MKRLGRQIAGGVVTLGILAGCGGVDPTAMPNGAATSSLHGARVLDPATTSSQDLMYVIRGHEHGDVVYVFSYPQDQSIGTLTGTTKPLGLCSDRHGDVFVTEDGEVLEYAHGGTTPIKTLTAIGYYCASDPSTGNLAVVGEGKVQIFSNATGLPQIYQDSGSWVGYACTYDNKGDLFIHGLTATGQPALVEFANKRFTTITLSSGLSYMDDLQWDGKYIVIDDFYQSGTLYRVKVSGSEGTIEGSTSLGGVFFGNPAWLQGKTFISSVETGRDVSRTIVYWSYPGGKRIKKFKPKGGGPIRAVTVSVPPLALARPTAK